MCLFGCGIIFLIPTDTEPTAAVAQNTAIGELAETDESADTAEPTNTASDPTNTNLIKSGR
jgi:hypothetical protein